MMHGPPIDRLSRLPDEVISHILSFLQTNFSAQTSLLSKRWKLLWTHVPLLEFQVNCPDYVNSNTITKVLLQRKHDIHTFRILGGADFDGSQEKFESLIVEVTTRNVRNLAVNVFNVCKFPQCLFTCKTLVDLSLTNCEDFPTGGIYLPALKKINLAVIEKLSHESIDCLLSGSPVLEELRINGTVSGYCCVSSPVLISLVLEISNLETSKFGVKLDTPALRYLRLRFSVPDKFSVGALDSLIEADIDLFWCRQQDRFIYSRNLLAFVGKLYNVKLLTLSTHQDVWIHDEAFSALPIKFQNLTKLRLGSNLGCITYFLENADNLQFVELNFKYMLVGTDNIYCWMEPDRVPACLISNLQSVVCYFDCSKQEFDIVQYILMNAKVLKMMEVHIQLPNGCKKKSEVRSKIALFERGSQECQIVFD